MPHHAPAATGADPALPEPSLEEIFTHKYRVNHWGSAQSVSGRGSELRQTVEVRAAVASVLDRYDIASVTDAGCGDFNWQRHIPKLAERARYLGVDIVRGLVEANRQRHGNQRTTFAHLDITRDPIPRADLILCRDVLVHLTLDQIHVALRHVAANASRYLLATTYPNEPANPDTHDGHWRPLNLCAPPFHLPRPIEFFDTDYRDGGRNHPGNGLGLWTIDTLMQGARCA